uniref:FliG C-terminal domain-containing protein n=1 Tax=Cohnella sp. GbtcB17 TaxID=2824762 RepID=UPI0027D22690
IEAIVQILYGVDRGTERSILDSLEIQDPELAEVIKKRMFVFEDIVNLDNRTIQRIIRDVESPDLQVARMVASEVVRDVIFR